MAKQVVHLIASLGKGGAETMLYQVLRCRTREDLSYKVVSLGESHYYEEPVSYTHLTLPTNSLV